MPLRRKSYHPNAMQGRLPRRTVPGGRPVDRAQRAGGGETRYPVPAIATIAGEETRLSKPETFAVDDRVNHAEHGLGKIIEVNARMTTISFDTAGVRKFLTALMRLERSDSPNPTKSRAKKKVAKV
jgi:hypothetical protein